jgi:uncharacterized protein YutD
VRGMAAPSEKKSFATAVVSEVSTYIYLYVCTYVCIYLYIYEHINIIRIYVNGLHMVYVSKKKSFATAVVSEVSNYLCAYINIIHLFLNVHECQSSIFLIILLALL